MTEPNNGAYALQAKRDAEVKAKRDAQIRAWNADPANAAAEYAATYPDKRAKAGVKYRDPA